MDLTPEEKSNRSEYNSYISTLLKNTAHDDKLSVLQNYRDKMSQNQKIALSLSSQNNDVLVAIQNLIDSSNEKQNILSLEIENALLSELKSYQEEVDKQKARITYLEKELLQKQDNENSSKEYFQKLKEAHQTELEQLSSDHQKEIIEFTNREKAPTFNDSTTLKEGKFTGAAQIYLQESEEETKISTAAELYQKKLAESAELSKAADLFQQESTENEAEPTLYYNLIGWPDFNDLTKGNRIIPLATRLMAQQMSLKQIEHFLGGPNEKERSLILLDELSALGLLISSTTKEQQKDISNKPEKNNRLQLFKRIRSSLGI